MLTHSGTDERDYMPPRPLRISTQSGLNEAFYKAYWEEAARHLSLNRKKCDTCGAPDQGAICWYCKSAV